jgi:hypothetical protein
MRNKVAQKLKQTQTICLVVWAGQTVHSTVPQRMTTLPFLAAAGLPATSIDGLLPIKLIKGREPHKQQPVAEAAAGL